MALLTLLETVLNEAFWMFYVKCSISKDVSTNSLRKVKMMIEKKNEYIHVQSLILTHFQFCGVFELHFLFLKNVPRLTFINHTPGDSKRKI